MKFLFGGFGYFFCLQMERFLTSGIQRAMLYERKLGQAIVSRRRKARKTKPEPEQEGLFLESYQIFFPLAAVVLKKPNQSHPIYHFKIVIMPPKVLLLYMLIK